jgi:hypothetical protein
VLVDILKGENLSYSLNSFLRDLLLRMLQFLTSNVKVLEDLVDKEGQILHKHFLLLKLINLDKTEDICQGRWN